MNDTAIKRGGPQPGSGRPLGAKTRPSPRTRAMELLTSVIADKSLPLTDRIRAAEGVLAHSMGAAQKSEDAPTSVLMTKSMKMTEAMFRDV